MKPADLLDYFAKAGHPVYLDGETLRLKGRPSPDLINLARARKAELLAALAPKPDPRLALYAEWLGGIEEPRAVVTLTEAQAAAAVAAGAVTPETAAASVLVAIRSPLGAVGLMAVPKDRYDGFELMRALEAAPWVH